MDVPLDVQAKAYWDASKLGRIACHIDDRNSAVEVIEMLRDAHPLVHPVIARRCDRLVVDLANKLNFLTGGAVA